MRMVPFSLPSCRSPRFPLTCYKAASSVFCGGGGGGGGGRSCFSPNDDSTNCALKSDQFQIQRGEEEEGTWKGGGQRGTLGGNACMTSAVGGGGGSLKSTKALIGCVSGTVIAEGSKYPRTSFKQCFLGEGEMVMEMEPISESDHAAREN